jgi:teichuronic acid biosynthesis glycosyltransferase TuaC
MNILSISTLFPTPAMPHHGVFVKNRLMAMASNNNVNVTIVNPIPTSLLHRILGRYKEQQSAPDKLTISDGNIDVFHPRYKTLPSIQKDKEHVHLMRDLIPFLEKLHQERHFDIIDTHWAYPDLPLANVLSEKWGVPSFVTLRGMETFYLDDKDNRKHIISKEINKVNGVISLSQEMLLQSQDMVESHHGVMPPSTLIRNGVDTSVFRHTCTTEEARLKLKIDTDAFILLGVGGIIKRKGFHHVIESLETLKNKYPERKIHYHILGNKGLEGNFESSLLKLIQRYNFNSDGNVRVFLEGKKSQEDLTLWYNASDLFCLSSFGEGSPNVLTEALSCGCPAIASNVGSVPDIMESEDDLGSVIDNQKNESNESAAKTWASAIENSLTKKTNEERKNQAKSMEPYTWSWCAERALSFIENNR